MAANGIVIEQAQIVTTHNLAALVALGLGGRRFLGWTTDRHWITSAARV
ncbi:hypothetical protein [Tenggerimyces flavus]|uniref:Uncharacterized protein n=1 Tax=Tenggerimyces flavus TaxID=1708749 RepID=A0ABV7YJ84_9ACTN|nr:hypothetical protein [Tenggerimyces flavus]MBM7784210.1 hypothetical protein [Tenggerimyces flavus]